MIVKLLCKRSLNYLLKPFPIIAFRQSIVCNFHSGQIHYEQCRKVVQPPPAPIICQHLQNRTIVRTSGADCVSFFQGLITNDMRCLEGSDNTCNISGAPVAHCAIAALYTMMLNVQGRVLYDLIMYKPNPSPEDSTFLIECDAAVVEEFIQTVKRYKIRKKVDIVDMSDEMSVWAAFPNQYIEGSTDALDLRISDSPDIQVAAPDPRLRSFGHRLILQNGLSGTSVVEGSSLAADESVYHGYRYQAGIGEGIKEIPIGKAIALEANIVSLNGVNFNKGCYVGQELVARAYHTGVIRKRLMPVKIHRNPEVVQPDDTLYNANSKKCGQLRDHVGSHGLALMRLNSSIAEEFTIRNQQDGHTASLTAHIPNWWQSDGDDVIKQALAMFEKGIS